MLENFIFSVSCALPIFNVMIIGYFLKRKNMIDESFVEKANALVFNIALPIKLFNDVNQTSFQDSFDPKFIIFIVSGTIMSVVVLWILGLFIVQDKSQLGAFIHGAFRGNFLYIGLSLMENITGSIGVKAPLAIAFIIPLYNILAVIILSCTPSTEKVKVSIASILKKIVTNPLIIAVLLGALVSQIGITMPMVMTRTMSYFEAVATPLALIAIGASFSLAKSTENLKVSLLATSLKLILIPLSMVSIAMLLGFNTEDIMLTYVLFGVPSATVSYVMTAAMNGDKDLASNIIMTTTLLSNFTMTLFIFAFKTLGII